MKNYQAELFSPEKYRLAEGPLYDGRTGRLSWVDIAEGRLFWLLPDGQRGEASFGEKLGAAIPCREGDGFVLALEKGLWLYERGEKTLLRDLSGELEPWQRCNDAKADAAGRLWVGTVSDDMERGFNGDLFCFGGGELRKMEAGTKLANGLAWCRDGKRFFFVDSMDVAVYVYDCDPVTGALSGKRLLYKPDKALPDGLCIDAEDNLWVALWGGRVERVDGVTGEVLATVTVPAERVTSCCFWGEKLDSLFITTFGDGMEGEADGRLYTCRVDAAGLPADTAVIR